MLSTWADDKSNEIATIPELLGAPELDESLVTTGTLGIQKDIAEQMADQKGDYFLALNAAPKRPIRLSRPI